MSESQWGGADDATFIMTNQYLVAKYISSPVRMEPRNIGVFVRFENTWRAKFVGENAEGRVDLRRVRGIVEHTGAYEQWVAYWRHVVGSTPADQLPRVLVDGSKVNFLVSEGAHVMLASDAIENPERTLDHLYHLVVGEFPVICQRERLQREIDTLKPEDAKLVTEVIRLIKAGRTVMSPAPERY